MMLISTPSSSPGFPGNRGEQLFGGRCSGDERGDSAQRGLLVGESGELVDEGTDDNSHDHSDYYEDDHSDPVVGKVMLRLSYGTVKKKSSARIPTPAAMTADPRRL